MADTTIEVCRPGGIELTKEAVEICRFTIGSKILDVGCGSGASICFFNEVCGFDATGIDVSEVTIEKLELQHPLLPITSGRAENLPTADSSMDGIFMECVLSLVEDTEAALSEAFRTLRPGGRLVVSDVYFRNGEAEETEPLIPCRCLASAGATDAIIEKLQEQGFQNILWQDKSDLIKKMIFEHIMQYGSMDMMWRYLLPKTEGRCDARERIKRLKPGYFLLIAEKGLGGT